MNIAEIYYDRSVDYGQPENGLSPRFVGIEVEAESVRRSAIEFYNEHIYGWERVDDGSLRNNGVEFRFRGPRHLYEAIPQMSAFDAMRKQCKGIEWQTPRTSVHVHVDVQDRNLKQMPHLIMRYVLLEHVLYAWWGRMRKYNNYCFPQYSGYQWYAIASAARSRGAFRDTIRAITSKYSALNLKSIFELGTVEFRHCDGLADFEKMEKWIRLCVAIVEGPEITMKDVENISAWGVAGWLHEWIPGDILRYMEEHKYLTHERLIEGARDLQIGLLYPPEAKAQRAFSLACAPKLKKGNK